MMHSLANNVSSDDDESISSETSDATSRATTVPDTYSDLKSDTTLNYQKSVSGADQSTITRVQSDLSSPTTSTAESVDTVVSQKVDTNRKDDPKVSEDKPQNQQPTWVNPYWGANGKQNAVMPKPSTDTNDHSTNNEHAPSAENLKQLIPGSILINDDGEIDDLLSKKDGNITPSTSCNSFNPGTEFVADDSGGPGGYLAPTHIQHRNVTSSPGLSVNSENQYDYKRSGSSLDASVQSGPTFNRQQALPKTTDKNTQLLMNSHEPKPNETNPRTVENGKRNEKEKSLPKESLKNSSVNPPASKKNSEKLTLSTDTKESKTTTIPTKKNRQLNSALSNEEDTFEKPTATNEINDLDKSVSFQYKDLPVPPFYERIYPPHLSLSSPMAAPNKILKTDESDNISNQVVNENEDAAYIIDSNGIVHYRPESTMSVIANGPTSPPYSSTATSQCLPQFSDTHNDAPLTIGANTVPLLQSNQSIPPSNLNNMESSQYRNFNIEQLSLLNSSLPSTATSAAILTEEDLDNIQHTLLLLETDPSAVPVIESFQEELSSNVNNSNKPFSVLDSLFTYNPQYQTQSSQLPPPSTSIPSFSGNIPYNSLSYPYISNSQPAQSPPVPANLPSGTGNIQYSSPSYPYNTNPAQSQIPLLSSLFQGNIPNATAAYPMGSSSQPLPYPTAPSYSANLNDSSNLLSAKGSAVLI